jgi:diaminohydroxyphosphoribosylaminopyrimidine deaminase/5-amino-6-(5-phosphoribosylamino)uracil reductase
MYMQRCLELAAKGLGHVAPNPMVGCVIVHDGAIISEGYHETFGAPHAEPNAIRQLGDEVLKKSTLYVNLEPCSHYGKTPPCADLIIHKGIRKVVVGSLDPNPLVAGKGIQKLKDAGIEVVHGVLENECRELNKRFLTFH